MKAYTPGNGREPGFVVSLYYEIAQRVMDSAYLLEGIVRTLEVDRERALDMTRKGFSTMTELGRRAGTQPGPVLCGRQEASRQAGASGP